MVLVLVAVDLLLLSVSAFVDLDGVEVGFFDKLLPAFVDPDNNNVGLLEACKEVAKGDNEACTDDGCNERVDEG